MSRPRLIFPKPSLRLVNSTYYLRWRYQDKQYEVSIGAVPKNVANAFCTLAASALTGKMPWPDEIADSPAVLRYKLAKECQSITQSGLSISSLIDIYFEQNHTSPNWNISSIGHLRRFAGDYPNLDNLTTQNCLDFLTATKKRTSDATRNRAKIALSGFISWLVAAGYRPDDWNPIKRVKNLPEARPMNIPHCNTAQRDLICATADKLELPDAIAVWVALYAGPRSSEIGRISWFDTNLIERRLSIRESKTGKPRVVPFSLTLNERLQAERDLRKNEPDSALLARWDSTASDSRFTAGVLREALCPRIKNIDELKIIMANNRKDKNVKNVSDNALGTEWRRIQRCRQYVLERGFIEEGSLPREICTWLAWRHTFGSLYAQKGVSLDKISAWMGNSPDVCRRHYAEFIPTDIIDPDIDRVI